MCINNLVHKSIAIMSVKGNRKLSDINIDLPLMSRSAVLDQKYIFSHA